MKKLKARSECPISFCLDLFGDKWSLLIIRDMLLNDKSTYGDFLSSEEGIATNVLTDRLKMLEAEGYIFKYQVEGKARVAYCLTDKSIGLIPIIIEMSLWGAAQNKHGYRKELAARLKKDKQAVIRQLGAQLAQKYKAVKRAAQ